MEEEEPGGEGRDRWLGASFPVCLVVGVGAAAAPYEKSRCCYRMRRRCHHEHDDVGNAAAAVAAAADDGESLPAKTVPRQSPHRNRRRG